MSEFKVGDRVMMVGTILELHNLVANVMVDGDKPCDGAHCTMGFYKTALRPYDPRAVEVVTEPEPKVAFERDGEKFYEGEEVEFEDTLGALSCWRSATIARDPQYNERFVLRIGHGEILGGGRRAKVRKKQNATRPAEPKPPATVDFLTAMKVEGRRVRWVGGPWCHWEQNCLIKENGVAAMVTKDLLNDPWEIEQPPQTCPHCKQEMPKP